MEQIEEVLGNEEDDPYMEVDLVDLMKKATKERESTLVTSYSGSSDKDEQTGRMSVLQHRIEELKVYMYLNAVLIIIIKNTFLCCDSGPEWISWCYESISAVWQNKKEAWLEAACISD